MIYLEYLSPHSSFVYIFPRLFGHDALYRVKAVLIILFTVYTDFSSEPGCIYIVGIFGFK